MNKKIHDRTQNHKEYNYSLSITSQFYFCGIPFRLDTTPKCVLNCKYCFAMAIGGRNTRVNQIANPRKLRNRFEDLFNKSQRSIHDEFLIQRIPLHFGGMSDPFSDERTILVTKELLKILSFYDYPIVLSTKNTNEIVKEDVVEILQSFKHLIVQISISSPDEEFSSRIEPNVPSPKNRIKSIKQLTELGIPVFVRLQPYFSWREKEVVNKLIPAISEIGVKHISVELLKLPVHTSNNPIKSISNACEFDILSYYQKHSCVGVSREWHIPAYIKWELLQPIISAIHKYSMTYGAADYGLNHLGDTDCCCGVDLIDGFDGFYKNNFSYFIRKSTEKTLTWNDFPTDDIPKNSIKRYMMSESRINGKNNIYSFLKTKWNRPGIVNSLDSYLGVSLMCDDDGDGNCVYEKTEVLS